MSELRAAVHIAAPLPIKSQLGGASVGPQVWSPISSTLIYSATDAVLVDTPITIEQTRELIAWIERIAPGRKLSYVYITHGHGDHFFGTPVLKERFPEVHIVATKGTVDHAHQQVEDTFFNATWYSRFGDGIKQPFLLPKPLPENNEFVLQGKWKFQAVNIGHADTHDSSFLWVPELRLAVGGDVIYGQVHQMLLEANTAEKREEWIRAIDTLESYNPAHVVPGHCQEGEIFGTWHIANTRQYLKDFGRVMESDPSTPDEIVKVMVALYPDRFNPAALYLGAIGTLRAAGKL